MDRGIVAFQVRLWVMGDDPYSPKSHNLEKEISSLRSSAGSKVFFHFSSSPWSLKARADLWLIFHPFVCWWLGVCCDAALQSIYSKKRNVHVWFWALSVHIYIHDTNYRNISVRNTCPFFFMFLEKRDMFLPSQPNLENVKDDVSKILSNLLFTLLRGKNDF